MKLGELYQMVIQKGLEADVRPQEQISRAREARRAVYDRLPPWQKKCVDQKEWMNPFSDSRILWGEEEQEIRSALVGIDISGEELLLIDRMREKGRALDLAISHHPAGSAYANFYEVMDLQVDMFSQQGVSVAVSENLVGERKSQIARKVSAVNHQRAVDVAKLLGIPFLCMHTPCDNLAYRHVHALMEHHAPATLGGVVELLYSVPEYETAAKENNPPKIIIGKNSSRVRKIHVEFTGGTEGPQSIYSRLASQGVDTIIAMHQSEAHFKKCKEANINVIFASHIASDTLGVNLMLDHLEQKETLEIMECSGFRRVSRNGTQK
ncbi:MAG: NGG1p interacting factor NIF3 [Candidatus Omnitrophica bacterium]|nr:NGG1p interacting factor NIF3 [Candidatus Omnitrophota bacterium]